MNGKEEEVKQVSKTIEYRKNLIEVITGRAEACKKIKSEKPEIQKLVEKLMNYVDYFNTIEPYKTTIFDFMSLNEVKVLPEFAPFVNPKSVRLIPGNIQSVDLLVRAVSPIKKPDYQDYLNTMIKWRNLFKKDISDTVTLESLKSDKSFADIMARAGYVGEGDVIMVRFDSTPFIPIPIAGSLASMFEDGYLNSNYKDVTDYYFKTVIF